MVEAPVGFQCPECVDEGRRTQRAPRTVVGSRMQARRPVVTQVLVATCVVVFGIQVAVPSFTPRFWMLGVDVAWGQWYRLVTCGFLHVSVIHILFNMWALWVVGQPLETMLGRTRFLAVYFVSLIAGSTASYVFGAPMTPSLGASGAIFGLFGAWLVVARRMGWDLRGILALIVINLALPFFSSSIDWHAHVGGLVAGTALTAVMAFSPQAWRVTASVVACVLLLAVAAVMVQARSETIRSDQALLTPAELPDMTFRPSLQ